MILSADEILWVKERMQIYVIKYQEIYDEILDHVLTAIEELRTNGDQRSIDVLFQNVVDIHFGGYAGIESLAEDEEKIFRKNLKKFFSTRFLEQLNWKTLFMAVALLAISYKLPNISATNKFFAAAIFTLAVLPVLVVFISTFGKAETIKGKRSLVKTHLMSQMLFPMMMLYCLIYWPVLAGVFIGKDIDAKAAQHLSPTAIMPYLIYFIIVSASYVQSAKAMIAQKYK